MNIAFISDIHGNFSALSAVLKKVKKLKIKKIYCLGDIVNYYYEPDKCIDLLQKNNVTCIKGNHEKILFETYKSKLKLQKYSKMYGNSIQINHKKLKTRHIIFKISKKITNKWKENFISSRSTMEK